MVFLICLVLIVLGMVLLFNADGWDDVFFGCFFATIGIVVLLVSA